MDKIAELNSLKNQKIIKKWEKKLKNGILEKKMKRLGEIKKKGKNGGKNGKNWIQDKSNIGQG